MVTFDAFRSLALSFPETSEAPHFEKIAFRVRKKIFATYDATQQRSCLRLSPIDQDVFSRADRAAIYPVANQWGKQGWTIVELKKVKKNLFADALRSAYGEVAPKKLAVLEKAVKSDAPANEPTPINKRL